MIDNYESIFDRYNRRKIPAYYPGMANDGFTPEEIMWAFKKSMYEKLYKKP